MRKILFIFILNLACLIGYCQYPIQQNLGAKTTLVTVPPYGGVKGLLINPVFTDTAQANTLAIYIGFYDGAQIVTTGAGIDFWLRYHNKWYKNTGGSGGIDTIYVTLPMYVIFDTLTGRQTIAAYDASPTTSGWMNTLRQSFAGNKTFIDTAYYSKGLGANGDNDLTLVVDGLNIGTFTHNLYSVALGYQSTATGLAATALGGGVASGQVSVAIGAAANAPSLGSAAFGNHASALGAFSTAGSAYAGAYSYLEVALGSNNTSYTPFSTTTWDLRDRLFAIGNGVDPDHPSDALIMLKTGATTVYNTWSYGANYGANYTTRSLVDKHYVDSIFGTGGATISGIGNYYDAVANTADPQWGGGAGSALRLQGCIASGRTVYVSDTINMHDTTAQLNNYQKIYGNGMIMSTHVGTLSYAGMFNFIKTGKYNRIDGLTFVGAGKSTFGTGNTYTLQNAIQFTDSANLVVNCIFRGLTGAGILGMYYDGSFENLDNNVISTCKFENNTVGVNNYLGGNYQLLENSTLINNYIGVVQNTPNAKIVGCNIDYNNFGFIGDQGACDRGMISSTSLNHNGVALTLSGLTNGYIIDATNFFYGDISLTNCEKANFTNCNFSTNGTITVTGTGSPYQTVYLTNCIESQTLPNIWSITLPAKVIRTNLTRANDSAYRFQSMIGVDKSNIAITTTPGWALSVDTTTGLLTRYAVSTPFDGKLSSLLAATGTNNIDNLNNAQTWNWNTYVGSGSNGALNFKSSSTLKSGASTLVNIESSGAQSSGANAFGLTVSVSNTGTTSKNTAGSFSATGGTLNYGLLVSAGLTGFNVALNSPTALVHIGAGTATANTAPLKFTSGTVLTTPEIGAVEFNNGLLMLDSSNSVRDTIATRSWARNNITGGGGGTNYWTSSGGNIYNNTGASVIINGTTGTDLLHVKGTSLNGITIEGTNPKLTLNRTGGTDAQIGLGGALIYDRSGDFHIAAVNDIVLGLSGVGNVSYFAPLYDGSAYHVAFGIDAAPTSAISTTSFSTGYVAKTGTYTAGVNDHTIDCTSGTFTVTLPTSVGITGRIYVVVNSGAGVITIASTGGETFKNIALTPTTLTLSAVGAYQIQSTGSGWVVLSTN